MRSTSVADLGTTPVAPLDLVATVVDHDERRANVTASLSFDGVATAALEGIFVVPRG